MTAARVSPFPKLARAAPLFAALGDDTRLELVSKLCARGPQSISRLTDGAKVSRQAVTKHLEALAAAGVVRSSRDGRERIWEVQTARLTQVQGYLEQISAQWDAAIERLRHFVET